MPQLKAILADRETKLDKNGNPFYKLSFSGLPARYFYVFSRDYNLVAKTWKMLTEKPEKLVNQLVLITYEELPNQDKLGTFCKVKELEII